MSMQEGIGSFRKV
jgi:DNA repair ATPase RecN